MNTYCKYYKQKQQVSYDNGVHWEDVPGATGKGDLIEVNSIDCGYVPPTPQYRTLSGTPYCSNADKYVEVYSQVSYDSGVNWETTATTQELVQAHSYDCGYRTRMVTGEPYCVGYDKYRDYYYQVSYNSGSSWTTTSTTSSLIEADSEDCGYVDPTDYSRQYFTIIPIAVRARFAIEQVNNYPPHAYFSLDSGSTWTEITPYSSIDTSTAHYTGIVEPGQKIMWKKDTTTLFKIVVYQTYSGDADLGYKVEGNIFSLVYGDNFIGQTSINSRTFKQFFYQSFRITDAENLILPGADYQWAYQKMFQDCTHLTKAPKILPATNLGDRCYEHMFSGCTALTTVPELPATTLSLSCYGDMFVNCTSLTTVPSNLLPATNLSGASWCYQEMFSGCTSLTTAPELPATTLSSHCYDGMFGRCTSLTTAPSVLPARTMKDWSYRYMFGLCSSLRTAPTISGTTADEYCCYQMFSGCTSLTTAPSILPAYTLSADCYCSMFENCTSLTTAPILPARLLAGNCYSHMFRGCTSLNYIKCLATTRPTDYQGYTLSTTYKWVENVASSGTFVKYSTTNWWGTGTDGIPSGWTVENATS